MKTVKDKIFDEERSLYNLTDAICENCRFEGEKDGESVLKETRNVSVRNCSFSLRYPLWHADLFSLIDSSTDEKTRAPIWYSKNGSIENTRINSIKCLRECSFIKIKNCEINSSEFGWKCSDISLIDSKIEAEYLFLDSKNVVLENVNMNGKYSFQYVENLTIRNSILDTKDAFWHAKNVTVENCEVKGEYLGWFSENLTLINCKISGTQPLCYCKNLKLIDCETENCDLSFEYSSVDATVKGNILSVKNPASGRIIADSIGEIILEDSIIESKCEIKTK